MPFQFGTNWKPLLRRRRGHFAAARLRETDSILPGDGLPGPSRRAAGRARACGACAHFIWRWWSPSGRGSLGVVAGPPADGDAVAVSRVRSRAPLGVSRQGPRAPRVSLAEPPALRNRAPRGVW